MLPIEKRDFIKAATTLSGSQDVGAQLFCALLRCVGVEARLVCSLQPLPFGTAATKSATPLKGKPTVYAGSDKDNKSGGETSGGSASEGSSTSRRRIIAPGRIRRLGNATLNAGSSTPGPETPGKNTQDSDVLVLTKYSQEEETTGSHTRVSSVLGRSIQRSLSEMGTSGCRSDRYSREAGQIRAACFL